MSLKALADYTLYSKYSHYIPEKTRREVWPEIVDRVFGMHERKFCDALEIPEFRSDFDFAKMMVRKKRVLGAQRALQFGGKWIEKENFKIYNCSATYIDRPRVFQEAMYILLCGAGLGFSVQKKHIRKLPKLIKLTDKKKSFVIPDSIEGWSDAIGIIVNSHFAPEDSEFPEFSGCQVEFDYSLIRPEGALIADQFKAPGPEGLKQAIGLIKKVIDARMAMPNFSTDEFAGKLRPIDAYDIIMHSADAVLSGGVRRSATLCQFSSDDNDMLTAKTGNWRMVNPQRGRSNNSVVLIKGKVKEEDFARIMESTRQFGEPGFIWLDSEDIVYNPCCEIGMIPMTEDGVSGVQVCNLTEINGKFCATEENFYEVCRASAILGTLQAAYTKFNYLTEATVQIVKREALLGCSITGFMDNPEILLNPQIQRNGAKIIKETNARIAKIIGINPAARTTCVKPAGSTSCILGTSSGIHPHHARRYIRRVQANRNEFPAQHYQALNPLAVEKSVWSASNTDEVISFLCEVPRGAILKNAISAIDFLEQIKTTQQNWVEYGTREDLCVFSKTRHNVSCTVIVKNDEWDDVRDFIFKNQYSFSGVSLLSASGDLDYPQAPFSTVLTPDEIVAEYGDASVFASGLVVDGLAAFEENLWKACDVLTGCGDKLQDYIVKPEFPTKNGYTLKQYNQKLVEYYKDKSAFDDWFAKKDWVRRAKQFAERYFNGDVTRMTYCLKHVSLWKTWCDIKREHKEVDWSEVVESDQVYVEANTLAAQACSGGACELK